MGKKPAGRPAWLLLPAVCLLAGFLLAGCSAGNAQSAPPDELKTIRSREDLAGCGIAILTGANFEDAVMEAMPESELLFYNDIADMVNALKGGKADALAMDRPAAGRILAENDSLALLTGLSDDLQYGYVFTKNDFGARLAEEVSAFLREKTADGSVAALQKKWFESGNLSSVETEDYKALPNTAGAIHLAVDEYPPFVLRVGDRCLGYEVELFTLFCRERGYALEVTQMNSDALLPSVQSGKCDAGASALAISEERAEKLYFSEASYISDTVLLVRKAADESAPSGFIESFADRFRRSFLEESRWKLFAEGIFITLSVTVLSVLLGTALGFYGFLLYRKESPGMRVIADAALALIHGMPIVVLLLILYYLVFGKVRISGAAVAIFGFTLSFGASVFEMIRAGASVIPAGQMEAAYSLGYSDRDAFFRVLFPQALPHIMPKYKGGISSLIKDTAIVGYVAALDVTKMGDIIRARTYDAFFPLIAVAVIYFLLAELLIFIAGRIEVNTDPKQRRKKQLLELIEETKNRSERMKGPEK